MPQFSHYHVLIREDGVNKYLEGEFHTEATARLYQAGILRGMRLSECDNYTVAIAGCTRTVEECKEARRGNTTQAR